MIKWLFRWLFRLLILLIVLAVAAVLLLNPIAKEWTQYRIKRDTGMDVKIGRFEVGILDPGLTVEHLVLYNSAEFGGSPFVDLPELRIEYDRGNFFSHNAHFKLVRINLTQVNVVENKKGRTNLEFLEDLLLPKEDRRTTNGVRVLHVRGPIDTLNLTLGKATFSSLKHPGPRDELPMNVHNQVVTNIKAGQDLTAVLLTVLLRNGISVTPGTLDWLGRIASAPQSQPQPQPQPRSQPPPAAKR